MEKTTMLMQKGFRFAALVSVGCLLAVAGCSDGAGTKPLDGAYPPESEIKRPDPPVDTGDGDTGDGDTGDGDTGDGDTGDGDTADGGTGDGDTGDGDTGDGDTGDGDTDAGM